VDECRRLLRSPDEKTLKGKRDRAVSATLLGCGLRRTEVAKLQVRDLQQREEHWAVVDLIGKGRHIPTVPVPHWVKAALDEWSKRPMNPSSNPVRQAA
jgi:site-specific recombinase XerD